MSKVISFGKSFDEHEENIKNTLPKSTVYKIGANFFGDVIHKEFKKRKKTDNFDKINLVEKYCHGYESLKSLNEFGLDAGYKFI